MEISSSYNKLTTFQFINSLFKTENTGILLEELDESEISCLLKLTQAYILDQREDLQDRSSEEILLTIRQLSTEMFQDAVEGLAIIVKENQLSSLLQLEKWLEKEEQRCLGFLKSPKLSVL